MSNVSACPHSPVSAILTPGHKLTSAHEMLDEAPDTVSKSSILYPKEAAGLTGSVTPPTGE